MGKHGLFGLAAAWAGSWIFLDAGGLTCADVPRVKGLFFKRSLGAGWCALWLVGWVHGAATETNLLSRATEAWRLGQHTNALALVDQALATNPKDLRALNYRAQMRGLMGRRKDAIADLTTAVSVDPKSAWLYHERGELRFKVGDFEAACDDFARADALSPERAAHNWQRGIALYYAGRFEEGKKLFELHRTVNPEDVENAAWHFLCAARVDGIDKARAGLIPVKADTRVPLAEVQQLFAGKLTPADVLQAAEDGPEGNRPGQRFYAYLYIGLYHEATGRVDLAEAAIQQAAALASSGGYMGDVARVHAAVYAVKAGARAAEKSVAPAPTTPTPK